MGWEEGRRIRQFAIPDQRQPRSSSLLMLPLSDDACEVTCTNDRRWISLRVFYRDPSLSSAWWGESEELTWGGSQLKYSSQSDNLDPQSSALFLHLIVDVPPVILGQLIMRPWLSKDLQSAPPKTGSYSSF